MKVLLQALSATAVIALVGCGDSDSSGGSTGVAVDREEYEQYDSEWPFTVDSGVVDCVEGNAAIFRAEGQTYQLNGVARNMGYDAIDPIWRDSPALPGTKVDLSGMVSLALEQCP